MIINGYLHTDKAPFVDVLLDIPSFGIKRKVSFLIDTGSPITILSEKDARKLKIDFKNVKPAEGNIMGLGGFTRAYVLKKVSFYFFSKKKIFRLPMKEIFTYKNLTKDEEIINQIPSLLGRDVLKSFQLTLDESKAKVSLKKI